ncbi:hypothetical protein X801_08608 [Opisthorchis viverrini]|uniref:Uncharacterized protein n=1 Tax=Opisthorchis viverrini TaxID=6198 RepID=A0A1S8WMB5_OPIVI|nr:hypothetical protein X801_08608 [Opisthorchis viverrini]
MSVLTQARHYYDMRLGIGFSGDLPNIYQILGQPWVQDGSVVTVFYDIGNYNTASEYLRVVRQLVTPGSKRHLDACWGRLASEILVQNWNEAMDDLEKLKDAIDCQTEERVSLFGKFLGFIRFLICPYSFPDVFAARLRLTLLPQYSHRWFLCDPLITGGRSMVLGAT